MSTSILSQLVMKDLYLNRFMTIAALLVGVLSVLLLPLSRFSFAIGAMVYLTTIIAFGVIIVMYGVMGERKEKATLFVLSLPISPATYRKAKLLATLTTFLSVWAPLTLVTALVILLTPMPDGLVGYLGIVSCFMLMNFCVVLGVALRITNEAALTATVIITNLSVSLFFMGMAQLPSIDAVARGETIVLNREMLVILACELLLIPIALSVPSWFRGGRTDAL